MLRYRVLTSGAGVLLTRTPRGLGPTVRFRIDGAQEGDRLVLTRADDKTIYRPLDKCECLVPSALLYGTVRVTLLRKNGVVVDCEPIFCEDVDGVRLLVPADMDLPGRVVQLEMQTEKLPMLMQQVREQEQTIAELRRVLATTIQWIQQQEEKGELPI